MSAWQWQIGGRWVCRHCPEPSNWWQEAWADPGVIRVAQAHSAVTFPHPSALAQHYRLTHSHLGLGIPNYLEGLR